MVDVQTIPTICVIDIKNTNPDKACQKLVDYVLVNQYQYALKIVFVSVKQ